MGRGDLNKLDWDDKLPEELYANCSSWIASLPKLSYIKVARGFYPVNFNPVNQELHVFCDASEKAIGHVSYIKSINERKKT